MKGEKNNKRKAYNTLRIKEEHLSFFFKMRYINKRKSKTKQKQRDWKHNNIPNKFYNNFVLLSTLSKVKVGEVDS